MREKDAGDEESVDLDDVKHDEQEAFDPTLIQDERRDYSRQRMMRQTDQPEFEQEAPTCLQNKYLQCLVFYFRRHPFLPLLIILIIQAVIEGVILFDVVTDVFVALDIY